ncbi:MAG: helix-turn-helix transcriptional regulator [Holophagaceae bacterium]|nr:helix-turn-helix transcriptional regulator [Holophagaceae bacterium]
MEISKRNKIRTEIAGKIRALREGRRWTQADLSTKLGLSQGRFSEIERGQGSFTAEQFLEILSLFNVPVSHFAPKRTGADSELQNALARLGAHLHERSTVLPSERLAEVGDVVREALLGAESARHTTSLAPVLVRNIDRINLNALRAQFLEYGLERRLAWLIENTLVAVRSELAGGLPSKEAMLYRRAELILNAYLANALLARSQRKPSEVWDILDAQIVTEKILEEVQNSASTISRRWGIATVLQSNDFIEALKTARVGGLRPMERPKKLPRTVETGKDPASDQPLDHSDALDKPQSRNEERRLMKPIEMDWD